MKITCVKCPSCGANLNIEDNVKKTKCQYCNTNILIEKDINDELTASILKTSKHIFNIIPFIFIFSFLIFFSVITSMIFISTKSFSNSEKSFSVSKFNLDFTYDNGTQTGLFVSDTLDKVIDSNNKHDKQIYVKYEDTRTNDEDEILEIKYQLDNFEKYEVTFNYDKQGYINLISITKK